MITTFLLLLQIAFSNSEKDDDTSSSTSDTASATDPQAEFIYLETTPTGDMTCFAEGYTGEWMTQNIDESLSQNTSVTGTVIDFETDEPVEEATAELFYGNTVYGAPDNIYTSDGAGNFTGEVPVCVPYAYRVSTDPDIGLTKVTIESSQIEGANATSADYNSVSLDTYNVIPALLGISPDIDKGIAAGTAYDCEGNPLEFAQVVVTDADGNIPDSQVVRYFVENFPSRTQEWTSEDGLFIAINIPEGDWIINMYVSDGAGGHLLMAQSPVKVFADSINISSVYTSFGDGVRYPDSCLAQ